MDFLKDKKNQPIVIGVFVAIILAVGVYFYFMTRPQQPEYPDPSANPSASQPTGAVDPSAQGIQTPATAPAIGTVTPGVTGGAATPAAGAVQIAQASASARPAERARPDPFAMLNPPIRIIKKPREIREPIPYPTWIIVPRPIKTDLGRPAGEQPDTTPRRMAGVLFGQTVSAILETGTETIVVRPGDLVENSTMRVEKIEPNRIVLKSTGGGKARYVVVKMAAGLGASVASEPAVVPTTRTPGSPPSRPPAPGSSYRGPSGGT